MLWNALTSRPAMEVQRQGELLCSTALCNALYFTTLHNTILYFTTKPYHTILHYTKLEYNAKLEGSVVTYSSLWCFVEENLAN